MWLAKKKTGNVFAIKAMKKEHIRETNMSKNITVEKEIIVKHTCAFLVKGYFTFSSMHHLYFALKFLP